MSSEHAQSGGRISPRYPVIVIAAVMFQVAGAIIMTGLSMFTDPINADLWPDGSKTRAEVQTYYTVLLLASLVSMPIAGRALPKVGSKFLLVVGGALTTLGLATMAYADGMSGLYASSVVVGLGFGMSVNFAPVVLINMWFEKHRSTIVGIVMGGSGIGGIINSLVFPTTLQPVEDGGLGWRTSMLIAAGIFGFFTLIPALFMVVNKPEDVGLEVYGASTRTEKKSGRLRGLTAGQALRTPAFWVLYVALVLHGFYCACGQITVSFLTNQGTDPAGGITPATISLYLTVQMIGLMAFKPLMGALVDAIGLLQTCVVGFGISTVGMIWLANLRFPAPAWNAAAMLLTSVGLALSTVIPPLVCLATFGQRYYSQVYGFVSTAFWLGTAFGTVLWSAVGLWGADQPWQMYRNALTWAWVLAVLIVAGFAIAMRNGRHHLALVDDGRSTSETDG